MSSETECELCEAAPITEWFYEDDECWVAECESCSVPMVVWRGHDPAPADEVKARLWARLDAVVARLRGDDSVPGPDDPRDFVIDDDLRSIPGHYHAHARPRHGRGWGWPRRA